MGTSNWTDLTASLRAFDASEGLYYGGPLGDKRGNATVKQPFHPTFKIVPPKNITYAYMEVFATRTLNPISYMLYPIPQP